MIVEREASDEAAYRRALVALEEALTIANTDPEQGIVLLDRALVALHQFAPLLATDRAARSQRTLAHLALARAKLSLGDEQGAEASIDAALRELGDVELSLDALGPTLGQRVADRRAVLDAGGQASVRVLCSSACRVWIDEHEAEAALEPGGIALPLGVHRVWIEDPSGELDTRREVIDLRGDAEDTELRFPAASVPAPQLVGADTPPRGPRAAVPQARRLAPRWAELLGASAGLGAVAGGAALWAIDSTCPGGAAPTDIAACPSLYDTRSAGITSVALGSALLVTSIVLLVVDERRARSRNETSHALALQLGAR